MAMFPAFLDTCTLYGAYLCDSLLRLAEAGTYRPLWSVDVLDELERALVARGLEKKAVTHRIGEMRRAFPDAQVRGYENIVETMTCDRKTGTCWPRPSAATPLSWSLLTLTTSLIHRQRHMTLPSPTRTIFCSTSLTSTRDTRSRPSVTRHAATPPPP
jgi:hypothetical protein